MLEVDFLVVKIEKSNAKDTGARQGKYGYGWVKLLRYDVLFVL